MIAGIRQQTCAVDDPDETTLISVVAVSLAYAEVWARTRAGQERFIGRSEGTGKVDSASVRYFSDGTVRLCVAAAIPGQSGSTAHYEDFDFPGALHVAGLDKHTKDVIYERVKTPTTGTHQEIRKIAYDEAVRVAGGAP